MQKQAFVFPGQGAQFVGMGRELFDSSNAARNVFLLAESMKSGITEMCMSGTIEDLSITINTQPCIFTVSIATAAALDEKGIKAEYAAGFSSGEVAALVYGGALSFEDGFRAILKRAELMHEAASKRKGCMAAVLRLPSDIVEGLARDAGVFAVNYNCPNQTVVAGEESAMASFYELVTRAKGRAMPLKVSGAFHSPFMQGAADEFNKYLRNLNMRAPKLKIYSNLLSTPYTDDVMLNYDILSKQIASPVLWQKSVENMLADGVEIFTEMQPGNVLTGLIGKIREEKNA